MPRQLSWIPDLQPSRLPLYLNIAESLASDIAAGKVGSNVRLPTHRDLAWKLGVTVGTVTRAYAEAQRRGLIYGEVGRGSFVRPGPPPALEYVDRAARASGNVIDLSMNWTAGVGEGDLLRKTLKAMAADGDTESLLEYQGRSGRETHRNALAKLMRRRIRDVDPERISISAGTQHALTVVLSALAETGDTVLVEDLTYPGILSLGRLMRLRLKPVQSDALGPLPEAFDAACRVGAKAFYVVSALHNPTGRSLTAARIAELAEIAKRYDVPLIEDDVYAHLLPKPQPMLQHAAPDHTVVVSGLSKCGAPGLRLGAIYAPARLRARLAAALASSSWMASPIGAEVAARWIEDGTMDDIIKRKKVEATARLALARKAFAGAPGEIDWPAGGYHIWLRLPEPWRARDFASEAERQGVLVTPSEAFVAGRAEAPHAVRICLGNAIGREELERGFATLAGLLRTAPQNVERVLV